VIDERNNTSKKSRIQFVEKVFAVSVCMIFLFSIFFPFYHVAFVSPLHIPEYGSHFSTVYWSFKAQYSYFSDLEFPGFRSYVYWFYDNGFYNYIPGPKLSMVFLFMIVAQILALVMGVLFILKGRSVHALAGMIFSLGVTISMTYFKLVHSVPTQSALVTVNSYGTGFWLTCLSVFLFLSSFIISHFSK